MEPRTINNPLDCHMQILPGDNVAENVKIDDPLKLIANIDKANVDILGWAVYIVFDVLGSRLKITFMCISVIIVDPSITVFYIWRIKSHLLNHRSYISFSDDDDDDDDSTPARNVYTMYSEHNTSMGINLM